MQLAVGGALLLIVERDGEREGFCVERDDARACADAGGNLRQDDERLIDGPRAVHPVHGLDYLAYADGHAVVVELGPSFDGIGREGAVQPALVVNVVVRLLDRWAAEVGARGRGFARDFELEEYVGFRGAWTDGAADTFDGPLLTFGRDEPCFCELEFAAGGPRAGAGDVQAHVEVHAGRGVEESHRG